MREECVCVCACPHACFVFVIVCAPVVVYVYVCVCVRACDGCVPVCRRVLCACVQQVVATGKSGNGALGDAAAQTSCGTTASSAYGDHQSAR